MDRLEIDKLIDESTEDFTTARKDILETINKINEANSKGKFSQREIYINATNIQSNIASQSLMEIQRYELMKLDLTINEFTVEIENHNKAILKGAKWQRYLTISIVLIGLANIVASFI